MSARILLDANQLKVSKVGYDVLSAAASGINFDSAMQAMGVYQTGVVYPPGPTSTVSYTTLGFIPFVIVSAYDSFTGTWLSQYYIDDLGGIIFGAQAGIKFTTTSSTINVNYLMNSSPRIYRYTIFYTPA